MRGSPETDVCPVAAALAASEARAAAIVDMVADAIIAIDESGMIQTFNRAAERMFRYAANEIIGRPLTDLMPAPYRDEHPDYVRRRTQSGSCRAVAPARELCALRADGSTFPVEVTVTEAATQTGRLFIGVVHDMTERKRFEQAADDAKLAAESANLAKSQFLANMSHEIRTPMTAIIGYANLLTHAELPRAKQQDYLEKIRRNGGHLLAIINDILDISKIEAGKLTIEPTDCDLRQLVDDAVSLMQVRMRNPDVALRTEYRAPLPLRIRTDVVRLRQIIMNLVGNALKFTERGSVTVTVQLDEPDSPTSLLRIDVADTGIGMSANVLTRLFQPFEQPVSRPNHTTGGTGLGLTISRRLARRLGGDIAVASTPGVGSTFTVRLEPGSLTGAAMQARSDTAEHGQPSPGPATVVPQLTGRVLVAEDTPVVQELVCELLASAGLDPEVVEDGRAACDRVLDETARGKPYDLILMDMRMPEMDGYEATHKLRGTGCQTPIVALTAHAMHGDRDTCIACGCNDHISKPIEPDTFFEVLSRWLSRGSAAAGAHGPRPDAAC